MRYRYRSHRAIFRQHTSKESTALRTLSVVLSNVVVIIINFDVIGCVSCHHGMARPQVADGGHSLQFWRVAANILNKQSRTADKGWFSSL
jgi:hypothetical protein